MGKLREGAKVLILRGANMCGNFTEGYEWACEDLFVREADDLRGFCEWIDKEIGGAGRANIDDLYLAYKNPKVEQFQIRAKQVKDRIATIRGL